MRHTVIGLILATVLAVPVAWAGYVEGKNAYKKGDYTTALREWRPLADQGDAFAQFGLGEMYSRGHGVAQDYVQALKWYRKAADQGNASAQSNLGFMYGEGQGVAQDYAEALKWYRKAADQGDAVGQFILGGMYYNGQGVAQDYVQAHMWLNLSAAQGTKDSDKFRDQVASEMTPDQIAEAQRAGAGVEAEVSGGVGCRWGKSGTDHDR